MTATSTGLRRSPLHDAHVAAGASFTGFAGWEMPVRYTSELAEHAAVRTAAGLFDLSHMAEILVLGPQAAEALDAAVPSRISAIALGQAKYTLLLADGGGILDDLVVYRTGEDRFVVVANAANRRLVAAELEERAAAFDTRVLDESDDMGMVALQGPIARDVLLEIEEFTADEGGRTEAAFADALTALRNYRTMSAWFDGHPVLLARTGYTGELGYEIYASPDVLPQLWDTILETGAGSGVIPAGLAARDTLRLEAGMPLYGQELSTATLPAAAGLGRVIPDRTGFVGADALAAAAPPARVLVGLVSDGKRAGRAGYAVKHDGRIVGTVTSGALSPTLGHPIAMAMVDAGVAAPGTELQIDVRGAALPARVTTLPFYRREA
jgi:aminomethyltransferase